MSNAGDDALLASTWHGLRQIHQARFGQREAPRIAITARQCAFGTPILPYAQQFRGHDRLALYLAAMRSNAIVFGGGSTLHTFRDIQLKRHLLNLAKSERHIAVGIGVGPFHEERAFVQCRKLLNSMAFIGVRDQQSYELCRSMNLNTPLNLTADLVPSLSSQMDFSACNKPLVERRGIGVSLCPLESIQTGDSTLERQRVLQLAQVINDAALYTNEPVVLMDFNGHSMLGDSGLHSLLQMSLAPHVKLERCFYRNDPARYFKRIGQLRCMLGMRLHAQIFAYLVGTPILSLAYHEKNRGFAQQIGLPEDQYFEVNNLSKEKLLLQLLRGLNKGFK
ncbi:MAG: polysaccharide pyruvyl transferase family protein, partial [Pseudomonadota bacterium]